MALHTYFDLRVLLRQGTSKSSLDPSRSSSRERRGVIEELADGRGIVDAGSEGAVVAVDILGWESEGELGGWETEGTRRGSRAQ